MVEQRMNIGWLCAGFSILGVVALSTGCAVDGDVDFGEGAGGGVSEPPAEDEPGSEGDLPDFEGGGLEGPDVCPSASDVFEAQPAESHVLFLVDRSGSMHLAVDDVDTRWTATKAGLFALLDAMPSETNAGLTMFPSGDAPIDCCVITAGNYISCSACLDGELPGPQARCDAAEYLEPSVSVEPMTIAHRDDMKSVISSADDEFYWGTPLAPALAGAVDYQVAQATGGISSVVIVTDGNPTSCHTDADPDANDMQRVIDAAGDGLLSGSSVRTYVLGVIDGQAGANASNLSRVAVAGGTARYAGCDAVDDCAYSVNVQSFEQDMRAALDAIALEAFDCTFDVPQVSMGDPDYDAVNVTVTVDGNTDVVPKDSSHADGWDYLPNNQQIQLYGPACEAMKSSSDAKVEVIIGCETLGI